MSHPVAPPNAVVELLGADGQFLGSPQALPVEMRRVAVHTEFQAQVDAFVRAFDTDEPTRMLGAFAKRRR